MNFGLAGPDGAALHAGLLRMLRPLVRLLLRRGITFPVLADLLRDLYVDVARHDVLSDGRAQTDSRISLVTGIHRKEIRRRRTRPATAEPEPESLTLSSQIVARWLAAFPWSDAGGAPRPLPRTGPPGEPTFDALIASVTKDLRGRAVLDAWLAQGVVRLDGKDRVTLNAAAYVPQPGSAEQWHYFVRNLHDHIAAASANVTAEGQAPFLERSVHYDVLTPAQSARLAALGRGAAERMLIEVNRAALAIVEDAPQAASPGPTQRVNLCVSLFVEDEPERAAG